jgi:hypothetical protein
MQAHRTVSFTLYGLGSSLAENGFQFKPCFTDAEQLNMFFRPYALFRISAALNFRSENFKLITPIALSSLYGVSEFCYL